jgi:hypothetical protein
MTITTQNVRDILEGAIERERMPLQEAVLDALRPLDGKKITKRFATVVGKALPDHTVYYDVCKVTGTYRLYIWGAGIDYNQRESFYLGTSETRYPRGAEHPIPGKLFTVEQFLDDNARSYSAATRRNEERRELLDDPTRCRKIAAVIRRFREAAAELHDLTSGLTDGHELRKLAELDR